MVMNTTTNMQDQPKADSTGKVRPAPEPEEPSKASEDASRARAKPTKPTDTSGSDVHEVNTKTGEVDSPNPVASNIPRTPAEGMRNEVADPGHVDPVPKR